MKKIAIVQSNYIPWKGYFDLLSYVDEFVIYDDVQYTRRDWRNRNRIKTPNGVQWLTIPVKTKGKYYQLINEAEIDGSDWAQKHWNSLEYSYSRSPFWGDVSKALKPIYEHPHKQLSANNLALINFICHYLGIDTTITQSTEYFTSGAKSNRLLNICLAAGATTYVSGPAAMCYLDESMFKSAGIEVEWFDYHGYPDYPQPWGAFEHRVTILDLFFSCGLQSQNFMRHI